MNSIARTAAWPREATRPAPLVDRSASWPGPAAIELRGLTRRFGDRPVLNGIDLTIEPGSFVSIVGRSGGGKSTLLRLLAGLDAPDGGALTIDGRAPRGITPGATMMFQDARLLPWQRVLSNVGIARQGDWRTKAMQALRQVGLQDRAGDWPSVLSGGQRQRVALARALVGHPSLLLLDEPLGALDALTRGEMQRLLERIWLAQGFTAVLVTHDVTEAVALSDRILVLREGRIALDVAVDAPRPRARTDVAAIEAEVLDALLVAS
jgi:sulfonate transport system ATP-binding protein